MTEENFEKAKDLKNKISKLEDVLCDALNNEILKESHSCEICFNYNGLKFKVFFDIDEEFKIDIISIIDNQKKRFDEEFKNL